MHKYDIVNSDWSQNIDILYSKVEVYINRLMRVYRVNKQAVLLSCHIMLRDKALSSDKPNGHWFEADWLHCKRDTLSSNQKVDGSRLTGSTQACHS